MSESMIIRKLPPGVKHGLRERAARNGRSVEAEVRQVLIDIVFPASNFAVEWVEASRGLPDGGELTIPDRQAGREPVSFE